MLLLALRSSRFSNHEMPGLKWAVTQLMEDHGKLNQSYKSIAARVEQRIFLLSDLDKLPAAVHDAGSNMAHEEALMGLAVYVNGKNGQSAGRDKVATASSPEANGDDSAVNSDSNDETKGAIADSQPRPVETNRKNGVHAEGPLSKRTKRELASQRENEHQAKSPLQPQPQPLPQSLPQSQVRSPTFDLARNIWIVNEVDYKNHGLCPASELVTKENPRISDLDFDRWVLIAQAQCDYNYTIHRLECRPSPTATTAPIAMDRPITIPMRTPSQWRGALTLQLQANPDRDPVLYMVDQSEYKPVRCKT